MSENYSLFLFYAPSSYAKMARRGSISAGSLSCTWILNSVRQCMWRLLSKAETHPQIAVQVAQSLHFVLRDVEAVALQVLDQPFVVVTLRHNGDSLLRSPAQQDLRRRCGHVNFSQNPIYGINMKRYTDFSHESWRPHAQYGGPGDSMLLCRRQARRNFADRTTSMRLWRFRVAWPVLRALLA